MATDQERPYIQLEEVTRITGLDRRNVRRLEKKKLFPRRIIPLDRSGQNDRKPMRKHRAGKVRWHRKAVEAWLRKDQGFMKGKVKQFLGTIGIRQMIEEEADGRVHFLSPPGLRFSTGTHSVTFVCNDGKLWNFVWNHRKELMPEQCRPGCPTCRGMLEYDRMVLRATDPNDTRRSI